MDQHSRAEDGLPANVVLAALDALTAHKINLPPEKRLQLTLHGHMIKQTPIRVKREGHQHVQIAVRPKVLAQDLTEQGELRRLPTTTELRNGLSRHFEVLLQMPAEAIAEFSRHFEVLLQISLGDLNSERQSSRHDLLHNPRPSSHCTTCLPARRNTGRNRGRQAAWPRGVSDCAYSLSIAASAAPTPAPNFTG